MTIQEMGAGGEAHALSFSPFRIQETMA